MKYKPARDIPEACRQLKSTRPVDIVAWILSRYNVVKGQGSITMFFSRYPTIKADLIAEITAEQLPQKEIKEIVFKSGTFETYESVVNWVKQMRRRDVKKITDNVSALKRICMGVKPRKKIDLRFQGWVMKHPDRLTLDDCIDFIDLMLEHYRGVDISVERMTMRNFLESKGIHVGKRISGKKHKSVGKYKTLYVARPIIQEIFDYLKVRCYEAYVVDLFMFKTGTRVSAALGASLEKIIVEEEYKEIEVFDKGGIWWTKHLSEDLYEEIVLLTGYPEKIKGKIFTLTDDEMAAYNHEAILKFYPKLWELHPEFKSVNHFWRHMFAQHMLRLTDWNYGQVAALGGWTIKALEESYGAPPRAIISQWGLKTIPEL